MGAELFIVKDFVILLPMGILGKLKLDGKLCDEKIGYACMGTSRLSSSLKIIKINFKEKNQKT
jgi:hypothetical protein